MKRFKSTSRQFLSDTSRPNLLTLAVLLGGFLIVGIGIVVYSNASTGPSGVAMPVGDLNGWKQIFTEDFTKDATTGTFANACSPDQVVYTGATGTKWVEYPQCYKDTRGSYYRPDQVLSVHDGVMDFYLHAVDGKNAGANPAPLITGTSMYQTYGRYSARVKVDTTNMSSYYSAWLLWPQADADWQYAESDFPEGPLNSTNFHSFSHYGGAGAQDSSNTNVSMASWHTFTQEWLPGKRNYYVDDVLVGTSTNQVFAKPERWQLQTETVADGSDTGHLLVDWVAVYAYSPTTVASAPSPTPTSTATPVPTNKISQTGNLATGRSFIASNGSNSYFPTSQVNDQNESTRWTSSTQNDINSTVTTDLGSTYSLGKVSILWAGDTTKNYQLQMSNDNVNWTTIASNITNNTTPQLIDQTTFAATPTGRYFRIVNNGVWTTAYGNSIWEIGLYGTPAATPAPVASTTPAPTATPVQTADTVAPSFGTLTPSNNASFRRTVTISASASDASGVGSMTIQVDGKTIAFAQSDYVSTNWNSGNTHATSGVHTITYIATDTKGNTATTTRTIYIK